MITRIKISAPEIPGTHRYTGHICTVQPFFSSLFLASPVASISLSLFLSCSPTHVQKCTGRRTSPQHIRSLPGSILPFLSFPLLSSRLHPALPSPTPHSRRLFLFLLFLYRAEHGARSASRFRTHVARGKNRSERRVRHPARRDVATLSPT